MKALKLFICLILLSKASSGQTPTGPLPVKTWFEYQKFNVKTSFVPPRDTLSTADSGAIATKGNTVYVKNGKWRPVADTNAVIGSDTFYLTHIGTSASQINTLFAVHGGIRVSRWGGGFGWTPSLKGDSLAVGDIDSSLIATHSWVFLHYGAGVGNGNTIYTGDGFITGSRSVSGRYAGALNFDSMNFFNITSRHTQLQNSDASGGVFVDSSLIRAILLGNNYNKLDIMDDSVTMSAWDLGANYSYSTAGINYWRQRTYTSYPADTYSEFANFGTVAYMKTKNVGGTHFGAVAVDQTSVSFGQTEGKYGFTNVQSFSNNAAAITGGLAIGNIYRNGDILQIVH